MYNSSVTLDGASAIFLSLSDRGMRITCCGNRGSTMLPCTTNNITATRRQPTGIDPFCLSNQKDQPSKAKKKKNVMRRDGNRLLRGRIDGFKLKGQQFVSIGRNNWYHIPLNIPFLI
jgi:hypothetical protein